MTADKNDTRIKIERNYKLTVIATPQASIEEVEEYIERRLNYLRDNGDNLYSAVIELDEIVEEENKEEEEVE